MSSPFRINLGYLSDRSKHPKHIQSTKFDTQRSLRMQNQISIRINKNNEKSLKIKSQQSIYNDYKSNKTVITKIKTNQNVKQKPLPFTVTRKLFRNNQIKNNNFMQTTKNNHFYHNKNQLKQNLEIIKQSQQKKIKQHMLQQQYHSLQSKKNYIQKSKPKYPLYSQKTLSQKSFKRKTSMKKIDKNLSIQKNSYNNNNNSIIYPIQFQNSSTKNKFQNTQIKAYGLSTIKSQNQIYNNHLIVINLGLLKQFYLIECIDGFQAGNYLKKKFSSKVLKNYFIEISRVKQFSASTQLISKNIKFNCLEMAVYQAFNQIQQQLKEIYKNNNDNSGCFITGMIILQNQLLSFNCGMGGSVIYTKSNNFMTAIQPHTTLNKNQIQRITKSGNKIYRTQFNVKYQKALSLKGPIRLYPSGFAFTRVLGKISEKNKQIKLKYKQIINPQIQNKNKLSLISEPEIRYILVQDLQFIILSSSQLFQFIKISLMCSIVLNQYRKYEQKWNIHQIAGQASRQIINQAYLRGFKQTATVVIVFFKTKSKENIQLNQQNEQKQISKKNSLMKNQNSLKYIGNINKFCQYQINEQ